MYILPNKYTKNNKEWRSLKGKTITKARQMRLLGHDDSGFLRLDFSDGSHVTIEGGYDGYTGRSEDEYVTVIGTCSETRERELRFIKKTKET